MKKFRFLTMAAAAAMMLGACSDDNLRVGDQTSYIDPAVEDGVFFSLNINLPTASGTRSETITPGANGSTSDGGAEIGQNYENYVGEVIVVLSRASKENNPSVNNSFIAAATVLKKDIKDVNVDKAAYRVLSKFSKTQLSTFYNSLSSSTALEKDNFLCNIYVYANPTSEIKEIIFGKETGEGDQATITGGAVMGSNEWINGIINLTIDVPTTTIAVKGGNNGNGSFLMSNALVATREIPSDINDWRHYTTDGNPFDLSGPNEEIGINNGQAGRGSVRLERAAARFDFKDGSTLEGKPFQYHVVYTNVEVTEEGEVETTTKSVPIIDVKLINMSLVNVNKKFYSLRRVAEMAENGTPIPTTIKICGSELPWNENANGSYTGGNYVVDADYRWKNSVYDLFKGGNIPTQDIDYSGHLFYPFFNNDGSIDNRYRTQWFTSKCEEVVKGPEDNNLSWNEYNTHGDYRIWTYATENTASGQDQQINGYSTGIVFKAKMVATQEALESDDEDIKALANAINNVGGVLNNSATAPVLYQFGGNLYLGWEKIRKAALLSAISGIQWVVPEDETDKTKGHWEFKSLNRSTSLYIAVFGNGGFGEVEFTYTEYDINTGEPILGPDGKPVLRTGILKDTFDGMTATDGLDPNSPDYLYKQWQKAITDNTLDEGEALADYKQAAVDAKITIYESYSETASEGGPGYYMYYYYWNRHDDNQQNGIMQPMEFAVVRNNVYKIAVTDIKKLGHPRISENDPERPVGGTPDEKEDLYVTVTVEVLPWVVRINDVEF